MPHGDEWSGTSEDGYYDDGPNEEDHDSDADETPADALDDGDC